VVSVRIPDNDLGDHWIVEGGDLCPRGDPGVYPDAIA
jgi:hypothetical protein